MSPNNRPRLSLPTSILAGVVLMFAMPLAAQEASYSYTSGVGYLTAKNLPKLGTTFQVLVPNENYFFGCGWYEPQYPHTKYRFFLATGVSNPRLPIPALNGTLFTSAEILTPAPWGASCKQASVTMSFKIPDSPSLVGVRFYQQVLGMQLDYPGGWFGPGTPKITYFLSRGGMGVIGK